MLRSYGSRWPTCLAPAAGRRSLTTMQLIKKLREEVQAPLNIVKSAVSQAQPAGDYEAALAILRKEMTKRGEKLVAKSADRAATEGWVIAARSRDGKAASLSVLNCETDFVAKSEKVVDLAAAIGRSFVDAAGSKAEQADSHVTSSQDQLDAIEVEGQGLKDRLTEAMSLFGESMRVNRAVQTRLAKSVDDTVVGIHCHGGPSISRDVYLGRMGAMINVRAQSDTARQLADELAREVVAQNPDSMDEFWTLDKVGDSEGRTVRQWAGKDIEITAWTRFER